ncbi:D123-domain-containing protein [Syncephalis plumigaleata]|nr:D123-domain-containing protein [Syncephalis plumigaleata]
MSTVTNLQCPTDDAITRCSLANWYKQFRGHTFTSKTIPLSTEFTEFLLADGIVLDHQQLTAVWSDDSDNEVDNDDDDDNTEALQSTSFPAIEEQVTTAIRQLGGSVFPKLTWSAPKDAAWIATTRNLSCTNYSDIILLLKSSDVVVHDLLHAYDDCNTSINVKAQPTLILRQWQTINPAHEFRCFVRDRQLIAISQRDMTYYAFLEPMKQQIIDVIQQFYTNVISQFTLNDFVFDIKLVDFAPFGGSTNPLLFTWNDLIMNDSSSINVIYAGQMNTGTALLNQFH